MTQAFTKSMCSDKGNTEQKIIQQHPLGRQKRSSSAALRWGSNTQNLYVESWPLKQLIASGMSCCTHLLRYFNYANTPCCHTDINSVWGLCFFEVCAVGIVWGFLHYDSPVGRIPCNKQHSASAEGFCRWVPSPLKLFLKGFWLYFWLLLRN